MPLRIFHKTEEGERRQRIDADRTLLCRRECGACHEYQPALVKHSHHNGLVLGPLAGADRDIDIVVDQIDRPISSQDLQAYFGIADQKARQYFRQHELGEARRAAHPDEAYRFAALDGDLPLCRIEIGKNCTAAVVK
ncbi:MAG TPA: hypothetical protein VK834_10030 [Bradyrhizobium sp.]|nr:hypothetical protein [Bradyrhizobium sp.]